MISHGLCCVINTFVAHSFTIRFPRDVQETSDWFKVAGHSIQVPMPNSPLLLNYLMLWHLFFARVKVNHNYSRIFSKVCAVAMAMGLVKNQA